MSYSCQLQRFNRLAATGNSGLSRASLWPVTVTLSTDTASNKITGSGSPASRQRVPEENGAGYIERTVRTFMLLRSRLPAAADIKLGTEFTITADPLNPENVGTVWCCFDLKDSDGGSELRSVCWRKDP